MGGTCISYPPPLPPLKENVIPPRKNPPEFHTAVQKFNRVKNRFIQGVKNKNKLYVKKGKETQKECKIFRGPKPHHTNIKKNH
jgi:hypothetical protein